MTGARVISRHLPALAVAAVGLGLTAVLAWAARAAHEENEDRLTRQRTLEAEVALTAAIPTIEVPLATAAALAELGSADAELFRRVIGAQVGLDQRFLSASLWSADTLMPLVVVGEQPALAALDAAAIRAFFDRTFATAGMSVLDLLGDPRPKLGYGFASRATSAGYLVYAEQALPPERTSVPQSDSAFADLDYALYVTTAETQDSLLIASTDDLPLDGRTAEQEAPFGDGELRLVVSPRETLGGELLANLVWIVLGAGLAMTLLAAVLTARLHRRRRQAETLAELNAALYAEQRAASLTLQQSLLPRRLPDLPDLDIAVRYTPGVSGTEVGGDWYDVMDVGGRTVMVVGDVSGRGLAAASVMAAVRHSVRTLAFQGDGPATILEKINQRGVTDLAGHIVTVLCCTLDRTRRSLVVASAGHPPPLVINDAGPSFIRVPVGPPIGAVAGTTYEETSADVAPGSTLILYTDGVYERRGETIDIGLERLRAATQTNREPQELVDGVFEELSLGDGQDDAALLAVRWTR